MPGASLAWVSNLRPAAVVAWRGNPSDRRRTLHAMTRRTWNESAIEAELVAITTELGRFPKRAELTARGVGGLWNAMQRNGGIDAWRSRVTRAGEPTATASHDDIARRAYFLAKERGGDPMENWLAAEQELRAA
jgi:hypothetical protein